MERIKKLHSEFDYFALANGFGLEVQIDDAPELEMYVRLFRDFRTDEQVLLLHLKIQDRATVPAILDRLTDSPEFAEICENFESLATEG